MKKLVLTAIAAGLLTTASAIAQTTAPTSPSTTPPAVKPAPMAPSMTAPATGTKINLTDEQAKSWVDKVIYTADGKNVGEVGTFLRDPSGNVTELHADIGGLMGIGETRVRLMPDQFKLGTDRVTVSLTEAQVKALPKVAK
jgi:hypothetical protein